MTAPFRIEVLKPEHHRKYFCCGDNALDRYFSERVTQDIRRRVAACYVAIENESARIAGFYTLSAADIPLTDVPETLAKRLPRYPAIPVAKLGRLAVDKEFLGKRIGGSLLWDALLRAARSEIAVFALVVDAKNENAVNFYRHHGFISFGSLPNQMILPLSKIQI